MLERLFFLCFGKTQKTQKKEEFLPECPDISGKVGPFSEECVICMCDFNSTPGVKLQCGHAFHAHCIVKWFELKPCCPVCSFSYVVRV